MILTPLKFDRLLLALNPNKAWILKVVFFCPLPPPLFLAHPPPPFFKFQEELIFIQLLNNLFRVG